MNRKNSRSARFPYDELPDEVVERLHRAEVSPAAAADEAVDRAVLEQARAHFATRPAVPGHGSPARRRGPARHLLARLPARRANGHAGGPPRRRRLAAGLAAAAVVFAALLVVQPVDLLGPADPDDIDRSGRVDILDAFALARMRAAGRSITETEIEALAERVVSLEPRSGSR